MLVNPPAFVTHCLRRLAAKFLFIKRLSITDQPKKRLSFFLIRGISRKNEKEIRLWKKKLTPSLNC